MSIKIVKFGRKNANTHRLLRNECDVLAVLGDIVLRDGLFIELFGRTSQVSFGVSTFSHTETYIDLSSKGVVEPLDKLNPGELI